MCWSMKASAAIVVIGIAATAISARRNDAPAIWLTLGYFTFMEALQLGGYAVLNECGSIANRSITLLSYLHIVFQPFLINAFAMELTPQPVKARVQRFVYLGCGVCSVIMLLQLLPAEWAGKCVPGSYLCGESLCTRSGEWHIAWDIPYNGLMVPLDRIIGFSTGLPSYMAAVFLFPLVYGAWRFVMFNFLAGPIASNYLTSDPNEMPAIWCLFSIGILLIVLSPAIRKRISATTWWGWPVSAS